MTQPVTVQPGPGQRANETPIVAPAPPAPRRMRAPADVVRRSLRNSTRDALAWSVMQGAGASYVMPFIILKGSGLFAIAAFSGLPSLATGLVQWVAANVTDRLGHRNRIIISCSFVQALTWLVFAGAMFLPFAIGFWVMLGVFLLFTALQAFVGPAWQSLMGDLVPANRRGKYFGTRNALAGAVQMAAFFAAGWWVTLTTDSGTFALLGLPGRSFGFLVLFVVACVARLVSVYFLTQVHEPEYQRTPADRFTLLEFIRRAPRAHFGRFVLYCMLVNVAFGLNGPFLAWYLLDQLQFSTGQFALIITTSMVANVLSQPLWGRLIDRMGSKYVLGIGGNAIIFLPLLLLLCSDVWHFLLVMVYDGVAAAAYAIGVGNYFYDVVSPPKRARCVAYNTLFVAVGGLVGAFGGAAIASSTTFPLAVGHVRVLHPFALLLICSTLVRLLASLLLLSTFDEFRLRRPNFSERAAPTSAQV